MEAVAVIRKAFLKVLIRLSSDQQKRNSGKMIPESKELEKEVL
jgi:hypothetical protein